MPERSNKMLRWCHIAYSICAVRSLSTVIASGSPSEVFRLCAVMSIHWSHLQAAHWHGNGWARVCRGFSEGKEEGGCGAVCSQCMQDPGRPGHAQEPDTRWSYSNCTVVVHFSLIPRPHAFSGTWRTVITVPYSGAQDNIQNVHAQEPDTGWILYHRDEWWCTLASFPDPIPDHMHAQE